MTNNPKQIRISYFNSYWLPPAVFFCTVFLLTEYLTRWSFGPARCTITIMLAAIGASLAGALAATLWNLIRKRLAKGVGVLALTLACIAVLPLPRSVVLFCASILRSDEDHFADTLTLPPNLDVEEPKSEISPRPGGPEDGFQRNLLDALRSPGGDDPSVTAHIESLVRLRRENPDILKRCLSASPAWRVFKERGSMFATRRWMIGDRWRYNLNGYYSKFDINGWGAEQIPKFGFRFTIGLSGIQWWRGNRSTTRMAAEDTATAILSRRLPQQQGWDSHVVIAAGDLVVEADEKSGAKERRLTEAALDCLEHELSALARTPNWDTLKESLPPGSIEHGEPSLALRHSFQPGLYDSEIWLNAGEPGMIYLKAYEVTKGSPLSRKRLKTASNEWVGWSDNPKELFLSNTHFTIYEGDWGKPYAARFEVWFVPDSGAPEKKLMEKIFKIEGWQR